jgi:uncharacterized protein involved in outer membrane biogenesis
MAETNVGSSAPKPPRRWPRVLVGAAGVLLVLLIVLYFVATSSGFFTGVILPRAGKAMKATITVSDASIHPFSEVVLKDLKVQTTGTDPLVTATEVRLRYSLMAIIGGKLSVQEVTLASPTVTLVENADGTSNLDPITKGQKAAPKESKPGAPAKSSKAMQVDLKKFALTGATVRKVKLYANGNRDLTELSNVNITLEDVKNGQAGKLALSADLKLDSHPPAPGAAGSADAKLTGKVDFAFSADLKPATVKGSVHFLVNHAQGALGELASFATDLDCDVSPTEIKQVSLRFARDAAPLGEIRVSGPLDMEKGEGQLTLQILSIGKRLLNLAGGKSGLDFGTTTINSSNEIQLAKSGKAITATGRLEVNQFQITRAGQTTPQMDLRLQYATDLDLTAGNAVLRDLVFTGVQKGNPLLRADLSKPMSFAWGRASAVPDSTLNVSLTGFSFADWKPFLGDSVSAGTLNAKLNLLSQQGGELMSINGSMKVENLILKSSKSQSAAAPLEAAVQLDASWHKQVAEIRQFQVALTPTSRANNQLQLTGRVDMSQTNAVQGSLKLLADALDLTSYYDLFAGQQTTAEQPAPPASSAASQNQPAQAGPETEPEAKQLPFRNFVAEANIARFYLHEVEITNLLTTVKLDGGKIVVKPFQLALNGAPVSGVVDLDLGVPGYKYEVSFAAQAVPLAPLVNSFQPERKGQLAGTFTAQAKISGAGTTGASLQKSLAGQFDMGSTNLNLSVANIKNPVLKLLANVVSTIPDLVRNPAGAAGSLVQGLLGGSSAGGGLAGDLNKSPINAIAARGVIASGKIDLQQASVQSPAFEAEAQGTVTPAPVLTNSTIQLPISISLERSVAQRINLAPANMPADATYAKLPDFLTITGTVGKPEKTINKAALLSLVAQGFGGTSGKTGNLVQGLGGLLGGKTSASSNAPASQVPANQSPAANPLNRLLNPTK